MTRVLVVEDSPEIARLVQRSLLLEGFEVDVANDGRGALGVVRDDPPDLIVLDLMLPDIDGVEICRRVRAMEAAYGQAPVPVLMLTALDSVPDRVAGLDVGADDYVSKPFAITELMARVRSLLRRSRAPEVRPRQRDVLNYEDLTLDPSARTVFRGDREIVLTAKQFDLLAALMEHPNQVLSYDTVMQRVWGNQFRGESNVLAVTVSTVRKALEEEGEPRLIQTVRGVGYVLRPPARERRQQRSLSENCSTGSVYFEARVTPSLSIASRFRVNLTDDHNESSGSDLWSLTTRSRSCHLVE